MISPAKMIGVWIGGGASSLLLAAAVLAAPPAARSGILTRTNETGAAHSSAATPNRLDLRLPDVRGIPAGSAAGEAAMSAEARGTSAAFVPFPAPRRGGTLQDEPQPEERTRELGAAAPRMTEESTAQQWARRFHREGLPLAKLWQSHSALVSLGLNQRGKPGLWLTQKIP